MRRTDREVKDFDEVLAILEKCKVLHLAMLSDGKPYSVPVNFGYVLREENGCKKLVVYFHGAGEGKKITALKENPSVCFSAECEAELQDYGGKNIAYEWTCFFQSVIGFGKVSFVDGDEKKRGLDALMNHAGYKLSDGEDSIFYKDEHFQMTTVAKIEVEEITGKIRGR